MNTDDAVQALSALAYGARIEILRLLVAAGEDGMSAGRIADACGLSASTLSFHLNQLKGAGLVRNRRAGRSLIYSANPALVDRLIGFLGTTLGAEGSAMPVNALAESRVAATGTIRDPVHNVLFLGDRNSGRTLMAEAILNRESRGRFRAFSAGVAPAASASGVALSLLQRMNHATGGLRPKPLETFTAHGAPLMHFVFALSGTAAATDINHLPGAPLRVHWDIPDPTAAIGTEAEIGHAYQTAFEMLAGRIAVLAALPLTNFDRLSLQRRLDSVGQAAPFADIPKHVRGVA